MSRKNNLQLRKKRHDLSVKDESQRKKEKLEKAERMRHLKEEKERIIKEREAKEKDEVMVDQSKPALPTRIKKVKLSRSALHKLKKSKKINEMDD